MMRRLRLAPVVITVIAAAAVPGSAGALGSGSYNGGPCTLKYSSFVNTENVVASTSDAASGTNCAQFSVRAFRNSTYSSWQHATTDAVRVLSGTSGSPRGGEHVGCSATTCGSTKVS